MPEDVYFNVVLRCPFCQNEVTHLRFHNASLLRSGFWNCPVCCRVLDMRPMDDKSIESLLRSFQEPHPKTAITEVGE